MTDEQRRVEVAEDVKDATLNLASERSHQRALEALDAMSLPNMIEIPEGVPSLGAAIDKNYRRRVLQIRKECPADTSALFAYVVKRYWYAVLNAAFWMDEAIKLSIVTETRYTKKMCSVEGQTEMDGAAWIFYNSMSEVHTASDAYILASLPIRYKPDAKLMLLCIACYWLANANEKMESGRIIDALNQIHEAYDALTLEDGMSMWEMAEEDFRREIADLKCTESEIRSRIGKAAAAARLSKDPKQRAKEWVFECWKDWQKRPDAYPSQAAFARSMLEKELGLTSQPSIEAWCREWKKQLSDAYSTGTMSIGPAQ